MPVIDFHIIVDPRGGGRETFGIGSALCAAERAGITHAGLVAACEGLDFAFMEAFSDSVHTVSLHTRVSAWAGVELVRIPPPLMKEAVDSARRSGADFVIARGECVYDQTPQGTNFAAVQAGVDILSCPGVLDEPSALLAAERHVCVEFSALPRCGAASARTVALCLRHGCPMICGSAASCEGELAPARLWEALIRGACPDPAVEQSLRENLRKNGIALVQRMMRPEQKN